MSEYADLIEELRQLRERATFVQRWHQAETLAAVIDALEVMDKRIEDLELALRERVGS